ncbi:hypothetical protein BU23DRAFT_1448 [Bimuria novae-zelandiae CBS 107.79]|uniref:gamma-glutamylcyclotransferase n=1 Tax=Bimuria novae-zelandiae CBS 107.79 TaxID=1447943 RepID=A0A6A5VS38_9PLEO|nr:hypothetical protein BU23DRAFT_1448 [Bimuria novae-zelandiae CBS 107.79]
MAPPSPAPSPTLYFGFGSNLWLSQMRTRCPSSPYLGIALLPSYTFIINARGYANVVYSLSPQNSSSKESRYAHSVYGLVYALPPTDEAALDRNEGVPTAYTKEYLPCDFWAAPEGGGPVDVSVPPTEKGKPMLVYVDRKRVTGGTPKEEYVFRMNRGIEDALSMGVPRAYVDEVMRKWIPEEKGGKGRKSLEEKAWRQAGAFVDENVGGG